VAAHPPPMGISNPLKRIKSQRLWCAWEGRTKRAWIASRSPDPKGLRYLRGTGQRRGSCGPQAASNSARWPKLALAECYASQFRVSKRFRPKNVATWRGFAVQPKRKSGC